MKDSTNKIAVIVAIISALASIIVAMISSKSVTNIKIELENDAKLYQGQISELQSQSQLLFDRYTPLENDYNDLKKSYETILSENEALKIEIELLKKQILNGNYDPVEPTKDDSSVCMLEIAPAYQSDMYTEYSTINNFEGFNIAGINYPNGFTFDCEIHGGLVTHWNETAWALFNLRGEFSQFKAILGLVDDTLSMDATLEIYYDGKMYRQILLKYDMIPEPLDLDVTGVSQLKILVIYSEQNLNSTTLGFASGENITKYGFGNPVLIKSIQE